MKYVLKLFFYIIACTLIFWFISQNYKDENYQDKNNFANAFEWEKSVNVYFSNTQMGSNDDCTLVFPLRRKILNAETFGPGALEALVKGLAKNEKENGFYTNLNEGVLFKKFEIIEGVAYVDFDERFLENLAGSCKVIAARAQIERTLLQLVDIDKVIISVNGKTEGVLEP